MKGSQTKAWLHPPNWDGMGDVHCTAILDIDAEAHIVIKNDHPNHNGQGSAKGKGWIRQDRCFVVRYEWEEARKDR